MSSKEETDRLVKSRVEQVKRNKKVSKLLYLIQHAIFPPSLPAFFLKLVATKQVSTVFAYIESVIHSCPLKTLFDSIIMCHPLIAQVLYLVLFGICL